MNTEQVSGELLRRSGVVSSASSAACGHWGCWRAAGDGRGDEQMGRSLLRVGVLPRQPDWEVDEGKEGEATVIGALIQGECNLFCLLRA